MEIIKTEIEGVVLLRPSVFEDDRGYFFESFAQQKFSKMVCDTLFVQDNESRSKRGVVRGLHYQLPPWAQSKLVRVSSGAILDVAVDIRRGSPTFGHHVAVELSAQNRLQLFIPRGFAHGFVALSAEAVVHYKCDNPYSPVSERGIAYNDPQLAIEWGVDPNVAILSKRDREAPQMSDAELFDYNDSLY